MLHRADGPRIEQQGEIGMAVYVDEAGSNEEPFGIDNFRSLGGRHSADHRDFTPGNGNVGRDSRGAGSVQNPPAANDCIEGH